MKKILLGMMIVLLLPVLSISCKANDEPITPVMGESFSIYQGQSALIEKEDLKITFKELTSDSRCPKGVECIWAGEAGCIIEFTHGDTVIESEFTQSGSEGESSTYFLDFSIDFSINPYPEENKEIAPGDYYLQMTVSEK